MYVSLLAALIAQAATSPNATPSTDARPAVVVHMRNFSFSPSTVRIKAGDAVEWINDDEDAHTVDSTAKLFESGGLDTHDHWTHVFKDAGSFSYFCDLHPYMKGTVIVK